MPSINSMTLRNVQPRIVLALSVALLTSVCSSSFAQLDEDPPRVDKTLLATETSPNQMLLDKFKKLMTGAKMKGMFTLDGRPMDKLSEETYEIEKAEKLPDGDEWVITARMKYGNKDATFPVPVEVKWAGTTPVITLDKITIPGLGTFSARVLFHGDRYAGTWQHDDKGGHMFGKIELPTAK